MNWTMIILSVWFFLQPTGSESEYCKEYGENASATYRSDSTVLSAECLSGSAVVPGEREECENDKPVQSCNETPRLAGYAEERFTVGPVLFEDMLNDRQQFSRDWVVQMAQADPHLERYARVEDGRLHVQIGRASWRVTV